MQFLFRRPAARRAKLAVTQPVARLAELDGAVLHYRCNICGEWCTSPVEGLGRETPSCPTCQSTARLRGLVRCLTLVTLGRPGVLTDLPGGLVGIGLSDHPHLATQLAAAVRYRNTAYHTDPRLDITQPTAEYLRSADFLSSSDVFEHVNPPVQAAFDGALAVLRPGGWLVLTVPFHPVGWADGTVEHYPDLEDWHIERDKRGAAVVVNQRRDGTVQRFADPIFHGGDGQTLEMRVFEERALVGHLRDAGFVDITVHDESDLTYGICWGNQRASVPITARRPA